MKEGFVDPEDSEGFRQLMKRKRQLLSRQSSNADRQYDRETLAEIEIKRRLLASTEVAFSQRVKSAFISYSGNGVHYFNLAKDICIKFGFEVRTGFDREIEEGRVLPEEIMGRIRASSVFLAIWTKDFHGENYRGKDGRGHEVVADTGGIPSVWMPFELGVAASEAKPFKILFEEGVHRLYIEKPFGLSPHIPFNRDNYNDKAASAISSLNNWFGDVVSKIESKPAMIGD